MKQRTCGGEDEIRCADADEENRQNFQYWVTFAGGLPTIAGDGAYEGDDYGAANERDMEDGLLAGAEPRVCEMGVSVTGKEERLEKEKAGGPNGWSAAEPGEGVAEAVQEVGVRLCPGRGGRGQADTGAEAEK